MNFQLLSQVIHELADVLPGARVDRVFQSDDGNLYLALRKERVKFLLLLSPARALPRMHLVRSKPAPAASPHPFLLHVRSRLVGMRVKSVALLNHDRIAEICFVKPGESRRLVFELFGPSANLFLLNDDATIAAQYHAVPVAEHAGRTLLPGSRYAAPRKNDHQPADIAVPDGGEAPGANASAETYYAELFRARSLFALKAELGVALRKALAKNGRRREMLAADLRSAEHADEYKQAGDLVLANLQLLKTGMDRAELTGYDGTVRSVALDPKRSPAKNAELYFKKYKKAKAGQQIIATRLHDAEGEAGHLASLLTIVEGAEDAQALEPVRAELRAHGYAKGPHSRGGQARPEQKPNAGFRAIVFRGWEILVGSSAFGNDYLTTKLARPEDLWLHAEGLPGSHVLVRNANKGEIPHDVLIKAASLAAYYSKGRNAGSVAVTYTRARFVRKPKGAKPGLVTLSERKTVMVRPDDGPS